MVHLFAGGAFIGLIAILLYTQKQLRFVRWCANAPDAMLRRVDRPVRYVLRFAAAFGIPLEGALPKEGPCAPRIIEGTSLFRIHVQLGIAALRFASQGDDWVCHLRIRKHPVDAADIVQRLEKELSLSFQLDEI